MHHETFSLRPTNIQNLLLNTKVSKEYQSLPTASSNPSTSRILYRMKTPLVIPAVLSALFEFRNKKKNDEKLLSYASFVP